MSSSCHEKRCSLENTALRLSRVLFAAATSDGSMFVEFRITDHEKLDMARRLEDTDVR